MGDKNMKAAVFYEKHKITVEDADIKEPNDNEVLIKVKYCGICGTDVHIYEGEKGCTDVKPPRILGHELSGCVERVGKNVTKVKPGDKVAVDPNDYCNNCYYCNNAKKHLCNNMTAVGVSLDGGFAEYVTVKALEKVAERTDENIYHEHVTNYIYTHPDLFGIKLIPIPTSLEHRKIRLTIDTLTDFQMQQTIYKAVFSENPDFQIADIVNYLDLHPDLYSVMDEMIKANQK